MNKANLKFSGALAFLAIFAFGMHLRTLSILHNEPDEMVYSYLAHRLAASPSRYDLQGALTGKAAQEFAEQVVGPDPKSTITGPVEILYFPTDAQGQRLPRFDPTIYDRPIFHHPPAFSWLLSWVQRLAGFRYGVLLSAFFHVLTVVLTALLARRWGGPGVGLIAAVLMATEAVTWVIAERIWIDAMLQALVVATLYAAIKAAERGTLLANILAGLVFASACLTKLPACLIAPAVYGVWRQPEARLDQRAKLGYVLAGCLPVVIWLLVSARIDGALLRFTLPTAWMIENFPYMARVVARSPLYFFVALFCASPLLFLAFLAPLGKYRQPWMRIPMVWATTFFLFMTMVGLRGLGFQLRFLAPIIPALCILAAAVLAQSKPWQFVLGIALLVYSLRVGMSAAIVPGSSGPGLPKDLIFFLQDVLGVTVPDWFLEIW